MPDAPDTRQQGQQGRGFRPSRAVIYLVLAIGSILMIFPFLWMVATSFKPPSEVYSLALIAKHPTLANFQYVFHKTAYARWYLNSAIVGLATTISVLFFDSLVGYTLAKLKFPGQQVIFIGILSSLMIPTEMLIIPWYMMSAHLHWTNTYWGIMFPGVITAFGIFLMRQFMEGIPDDLLDAARIDGLNEFQIFWQIALPQVRPALAALAIFTFLGNWNAYLWPVIIASDTSMYTLPVGIATFSSANSDQWHLIMTASTVAVVPVLAVFAYFQRQIIEGITLTGLKG